MIGEEERFWNFCFVHWDYKKFWSVYWCKEVIFWDSRTMELLDMEVGAFSLPCKFTNCEDDLFGVFRHSLGCSGSWKEIFIFTFIYIFIYLEGIRPHQRVLHRALLLLGNFDMVLFPHECNNCLSSTMGSFNGFIEDCNLINIPCEQEGNLTPKILAFKALRKGELKELVLREEVLRGTKAWVRWVKKGDCNSKYFHRVANGRREVYQIFGEQRGGSFR